MIPTQLQTQTLGVSSSPNHVVTLLCLQCGLKPVTKKFCSSVCRQANYRKSATYEGAKAKGRLHRWNRRRRWQREKVRSMALGFDGRFGGHENKNMPSLGNFEKYSAEAYLVRALQQVITLTA